MKSGYSDFEHRYLAMTGESPHQSTNVYFPITYSMIRYCRPSGDPNDPPAEPTEARKTMANYFRAELREAGLGSPSRYR